jgi:hypothetical protein
MKSSTRALFSERSRPRGADQDSHESDPPKVVSRMPAYAGQVSAGRGTSPAQSGLTIQSRGSLGVLPQVRSQMPECFAQPPRELLVLRARQRGAVDSVRPPARQGTVSLHATTMIAASGNLDEPPCRWRRLAVGVGPPASPPNTSLAPARVKESPGTAIALRFVRRPLNPAGPSGPSRPTPAPAASLRHRPPSRGKANSPGRSPFGGW